MSAADPPRDQDCHRITLDPAGRRVEVSWPSGGSDRFHYVWLRHAARCPGGMPNDTVNKLELLPDDPGSLVVESFELQDEQLTLRWADGGLVTRHALADLRASAYGEAHRAARRRQPVLWGGAEAAQPPCWDAGVLDRPEDVLALFLAVRDYGLARIRSLPAEAGQVIEVARRFGPIYVSNYGDLFDVRSDFDQSLGSNTPVSLGPHTDEGYRHAPPGISFFHCLEAAPDGGGESILVDGFQAARRLEEEDPESYAVLRDTPVLFRRFCPPDEDMRARGRVIATDIDGVLEGIRFTDRTIPPQDLPEKRVEPLYRALKAFWNRVNDPEAQFRYQMQPGDLHVFDNQRVLHGRTAFDPAKGARHLQQCAVARDEFHNRLRLLAAELGHPAADADMAGGALG